jgi:hypothetical protein
VVAVLTIALGASIAHAQPSTIEPTPLPTSETKNPVIATTLSIVGTLAPIGLMASGDETLIGGGVIASFFTPSLGHWYAGKFATAGMAARGVGGGLMIAGVAIALDQCGFEGSCDSTAGTVLALTGAGLYVGGAIWDIATASRTAEDWNAANFRITPTAVPSASGPSPGVSITGEF